MVLKSSPQLWLSLICFTLIACSEKKTDSRKEELKAKESEQEEMLNRLRASFPGINEFNSSADPFTFVLQDKMRHNPLFLFTGFELFDVSRRDSTWIVELKNGFWKRHMLELTCDSSMAQRVIDASTGGDSAMDRSMLWSGPSAIVARVRSVNRIKFYITSTGELDGEDVHSRIELDADPPLLITGELVEMQ